MKFKVGDKVKNIITGDIGKVVKIYMKLTTGGFKEEIDKKLGVFNRIYCVEYECNEHFPVWQNIVEIEKVEEILDEKEKEYLKNFVKPFKKRIACIEKLKLGTKNYEYIKITFNDFTYFFGSISFPLFKEGTMYKGMENNKLYTLKDLNLD